MNKLGGRFLDINFWWHIFINFVNFVKHKAQTLAVVLILSDIQVF